MRVLHVAPHPDDEVLGAGATLLELRDRGHEVVNAAWSFGSDPERREQRRAEAQEACRRMRIGFRPDARAALAGSWDLIVAPDPSDAHPTHAAAGRAVREARGAVPCWTWALWSELPRPTRLVAFGPERLDELDAALGAHASELARIDLRGLLRARAELARIRGPELIAAFGASPLGPVPEPYAELLAER